MAGFVVVQLSRGTEWRRMISLRLIPVTNIGS